MTQADAIPREEDVAWDGPDASGRVGVRFFAFDTVVACAAYAPEPCCRRAFGAGIAACRRYERLFSRTLPHSDVARLNAAGGARVAVAPETAEVLRAALFYCEEGCGRFDVTVGAASRLWDFRARRAPDAAALARAAAHVDWRGVHVERDASDAPGVAGAQGAGWCAWLDDPCAEVDLGGIAKGWIADALAAAFLRAGLSSFSIDLGGNVVVRGEKPHAAPWRVGVRDPRDPRSLATVLSVRDVAVVTSGVYERSFTRAGELFHHVLDPATGRPVRTDLASATCVAARALDAEGYSTTLLALGSRRAAAFVRTHPAILRAYLIDVAGRLRCV